MTVYRHVEWQPQYTHGYKPRLDTQTCNLARVAHTGSVRQAQSRTFALILVSGR